MKQATSGMSIASMILGILSLILCCVGFGGLLGIVGFILGLIVLIKKKPGKGLAITGVITSIIGMLLSLLVVIGLIASPVKLPDTAGTVGTTEATATANNETKKASETSTNAAAPETTAAAKDSFNVGEVADIKGVQVSLVGVTESNGSQYIKPDDGNVFALCEFEINNSSEKDISVSSILSFEAYCDDYSIDQDIMGLQAPEAKGKKTLDGTVAAGKKMNGVIAYQVPKDWKELEIKFSPSFWSKAVTFVANKE